MPKRDIAGPAATPTAAAASRRRGAADRPCPQRPSPNTAQKAAPSKTKAPSKPNAARRSPSRPATPSRPASAPQKTGPASHTTAAAASPALHNENRKLKDEVEILRQRLQAVRTVLCEDEPVAPGRAEIPGGTHSDPGRTPAERLGPHPVSGDGGQSSSALANDTARTVPALLTQGGSSEVMMRRPRAQHAISNFALAEGEHLRAYANLERGQDLLQEQGEGLDRPDADWDKFRRSTLEVRKLFEAEINQAFARTNWGWLLGESGNPVDNVYVPVYEAVYYSAIVRAEPQGAVEYVRALDDARRLRGEDISRRPIAQLSVAEDHTDAAALFASAAYARPLFIDAISEVVRHAEEEHSFRVAETKKPFLKRVLRVLEKAALRNGRQHDLSGIGDVVRTMIVVTSMAQAAILVRAFCADINHLLAPLKAKHGLSKLSMRVVRVKDRFYEQPPPSGWHDCLLNIEIVAVPAEPEAVLHICHTHICELSIVHTLMYGARSSLMGHKTYASLRNGAELMEMRIGPVATFDLLQLIRLRNVLGGGDFPGDEEVTNVFSLINESSGLLALNLRGTMKVEVLPKQQWSVQKIILRSQALARVKYELSLALSQRAWMTLEAVDVETENGHVRQATPVPQKGTTPRHIDMDLLTVG